LKNEILKAEAEPLRSGTYVIRPEGTLGTMGWVNGIPWTAEFVKGHQVKRALEKYQRDLNNRVS
jgi:hypothetical protein